MNRLLCLINSLLAHFLVLAAFQVVTVGGRGLLGEENQAVFHLHIMIESPEAFLAHSWDL